MPRHLLAAIAATVVLMGFWAPATAYDGGGGEPAAEAPAAEETPMVHDGLGLRFGLLFNALFDVEEASAMRYFDFGVRSKTGEYYVDFRLPGVMAVVDGVILFWRVMAMDNPRAEPFLEMMNSGLDPSHWEIGHGRIGYRFLLVPPGDYEVWDRSWEAAVGFFGTADIALFELRRDVEQGAVGAYQDPLVIGAGGFFAIGRTNPEVQYDVALGVGRAVAGMDMDADRDVTIITADADLQFTGGMERTAIYVRPRLTTYITDMEPAMHTAGGLTFGVNVGF